MPDNAVINPFPTITLSEVIDIIFVAILLYTAIVWAQRTRAVFVVRGIVILGATHTIAPSSPPQTTAWPSPPSPPPLLLLLVPLPPHAPRPPPPPPPAWPPAPP